MVERRKVITATISLLAIGASSLVFIAMFAPEGCGPTDDERQLLATLNSLEQVVEHGGHVKSISRVQDDDDRENVYRFEAEILDKNNVAIGRVRGGRVEGFGTMRPRFLWYKTPGVPEDWPPRQGRRHRH